MLAHALLVLSAFYIGVFTDAHGKTIDQPFTNAVTSQNITSVAKKEIWRRLLHYRANLKRSEVSDKRFFLSPQGALNPELELAADLEKIKSETPSTPANDRFACNFPARWRFLQKYFVISATPVACPELSAWRERAEPDKVVFILTGQYMGNPASAFGHSFIRFDRDTRAGLLGHSFSFFAQATEAQGAFTYAMKGLLGGYVGQYQFDKYYPKAHSYGSVENREIWEYELKFSREERERVFEHAWELSRAGDEKYFFLDRNCTFQLLQVLHVANESVQLIEKSDGFFVTPQDTLKVLARAGLVGNAYFRPSLRQKAVAAYSGLNHSQKENLELVLHGRLAPEGLTDPYAASALVATLAMNDASESASAADKSLFTRATMARSQLPTIVPSTSATAVALHSSALSRSSLEGASNNPLNSHETLQASIGVFSNTRGFTGHNAMAAAINDKSTRLGFRPALHSLNDAAEGFLPHTQLVLLNTVLQTDNEGSARLYEFDLIDAKSLQPYSRVNNKMSWAAQSGIQPLHATRCNECESTWRNDLHFGYATEVSSYALGFALAGPTIDILRSDGRESARLGPSLEVGVISQQLKYFIFRLEERFDYFVSGPFNTETVLTSEASATWLVNKNSTVTLSGQNTQNLRETRLYDREWGATFGQSF